MHTTLKISKLKPQNSYINCQTIVLYLQKIWAQSQFNNSASWQQQTKFSSLVSVVNRPPLIWTLIWEQNWTEVHSPSAQSHHLRLTPTVNFFVKLNIPPWLLSRCWCHDTNIWGNIIRAEVRQWKEEGKEEYKEWKTCSAIIPRQTP